MIAVVDVAPHALHVGPVAHDAMLYRVRDLESASMLRDARAHDGVGALERTTWHDAPVLTAPHVRGEHDAWLFAARETSFDHTTAIVDDDWLVAYHRLVHGSSLGLGKSYKEI